MCIVHDWMQMRKLSAQSLSQAHEVFVFMLLLFASGASVLQRCRAAQALEGVCSAGSTQV
jgi:hypothetical protein